MSDKILFQCDYNEGAHPKVLERLVQTNMEQTPGYSEDSLAVERRVGTDSMVTEKKADSIQSVDIRKNVPVRMNPREMKENNAADHSHPDRPQRIKRRN